MYKLINVIIMQSGYGHMPHYFSGQLNKYRYFSLAHYSMKRLLILANLYYVKSVLLTKQEYMILALQTSFVMLKLFYYVDSCCAENHNK